ncbi:MAG: efflux RND transporter periplasmic adaptor subunit [Isosphaeraceae bacterium]
MSRQRVRWRRATCLAALGAMPAVLAGCARSPAEPAARADTPSAAPAVRVAVVRPERSTVRRTSEQPGQIEAAETTPIYAKLVGHVETVAVDIGDRVRKGQLLAELRVPEIEADVKQKRAAVKQAEAERKQSEAAVEVADSAVARARARVQEIRAGIRRSDADVSRWRSEAARVEQLFRERALTGSLLDETRSKLQAAEAGAEEVKAQVQSSEAALVEAGAMLDKARSDLDAAASRIEVARFEAEHAEAMASYTRIVSPFDGVVTTRGIDSGHLTTAGTSGEPLFIVARSDVATITVGVPETEAPFVNPGDRAMVRLQALGGRAFEGKVTRTAWALHPSTRTLRAEIDLPNPENVLRPGLYAYVSIIADEHRDALTVPAAAVVADAGKSYCVTVQDGHARRNEVTLGLSDGKRTEVLSGLDEREAVVEANAASLVEGQPVAASQPPTGTARPKS